METAIVDIFEISFDGAKGVGKLPEGRVIFVPRTAPGDTVRVQITQTKKSFCQGEVVEILTPSPYRVLPPCSIYEECGGCQIQHIEYSAQIQAKQNILQRYVERASPTTALLPFVSSDEIWEYRNRIEAHFKNHRWGFFKRRSHDLVFTDRCHIARPSLNNTLNSLNLESGHVHVAEIKPPQESTTEHFPEVLVDYGRKRGLQGVFSQVNDGVNTKIKDVLKQSISSLQWELAVDMYSGSGNFSSILAEAQPSASIHCVELSQALVHEGRKTLEHLEQIEWYQMPCEHYDFTPFKHKQTLVVLDPPRTGCEPRLLKKILQNPQIKNLIYISCNPPMLFRDLNLLKEEFSLHSLQGFDMFPQTMHFEAFAVLKRAH